MLPMVSMLLGKSQRDSWMVILSKKSTSIKLKSLKISLIPSILIKSKNNLVALLLIVPNTGIYNSLKTQAYPINRPPKFNSANHFVSAEEEDRLLITKDEYQRKFQMGELQNMKINKNFTFGMGSSILKFTPKGEEQEEEEDGYENPSPLRVSGNTNDYQQRGSLRSLFGETPYHRMEKQFKFEDFAGNNSDENTDYVEDMNENLRWGQERHFVRSFEASFL